MGAGTRVVGVVVAAALLVAGCSARSGEGGRDAVAVVNEAQRGGGGWASLAIQAEHVERYDTLAEMAMKADVVVIAQATGVDGGRRTGGEGPESSGFVQVRFAVIRAISDWDADTVVVELDEPLSAKDLEEQVAGFPPAVLLLREKGTAEEEGSYRLVNDQALWTEQPDGGLFPPLDTSPFEGPFGSELGELTDLEDLGDHLEAARRTCDPECGRGPRPTRRGEGGGASG